MRRVIPFVGLMVIWLMLTWSVEWTTLVTGVVLALGITLVLGDIYAHPMLRIFSPVRWFWFVVYVFYFLYYCLRSNLDVAYRALHPDVPIRPGIVKVRSDLQTDIAKTFLANSITLTPGTLTIDIKGSDLFVHWINVVTDDPEEQTQVIVKRFERILRRIFE